MNKRFNTYVGSLVFMLSTLFATVGLGQVAHAALPGQVGDAPRCSVDAVGARASAFKVSGNDATVAFKVSGPSDCKVRVSTNSYFAPSMDGTPYSAQILYQRITKVYDKAGTYSITASLPPKSTPAKGCFYQVDLTYGTHNVQPVLAYGHGKLDCSQPQPTYACINLTVDKISRTKFTFTANANATNGATIQSYEFGFGDGFGITTPNKSYTYEYKTAGTFTATVAVNVNVNGVVKKVTAPACAQSVTVTAPPTTPVYACSSLMATLISKENRSYTYNLKYQAEDGATLRDVDFDFGDGQTQKAVLPAALGAVPHSYAKEGTYTTVATLHFLVASVVKDVQCQVTINVSPDACAFNPSLPKDSPDCKEAVAPATVASTGPTDIALGGLGLSSLTAAGYYWRSSRNRLISKLLGR